MPYRSRHITSAAELEELVSELTLLDAQSSDIEHAVERARAGRRARGVGWLLLAGLVVCMLTSVLLMFRRSTRTSDTTEALVELEAEIDQLETRLRRAREERAALGADSTRSAP